jgi:hypothetical protein
MARVDNHLLVRTESLQSLEDLDALQSLHAEIKNDDREYLALSGGKRIFSASEARDQMVVTKAYLEALGYEWLIVDYHDL